MVCSMSRISIVLRTSSRRIFVFRSEIFGMVFQIFGSSAACHAAFKMSASEKEFSAGINFLKRNPWSPPEWKIGGNNETR